MLVNHYHESESLFDCEEEEELKVGLKYKEKGFSSWDNHIIQVNFERKSKILDEYVQQLVVSGDLDATRKIKEMLIGDSKLAAGLNPLVFKCLVDILADQNSNESTKGSAACILAFANFDECGVDIKKWNECSVDINDLKIRATEVLVELMSHNRETISIPVLRTLTRLAYFSADYAKFIIEKGALNGDALSVPKAVFPSAKKIHNLAKFLVVVVRQMQVPGQVQVPEDKVGAVVSILDKILQVRRCNLRCIMRACYALSYIPVKWWVNKGNILNNVIDLVWNVNGMVASSALRVATKIVDSENYREILTTNYKFLKYLRGSDICGRPKKFQKEACYIISNMAAKGGTSKKDLHKSGLMDALAKLLEVNDFDVRMGAARALSSVIRCNMTRDVAVS